jgi:ribonucleoside-diphosphate reductase alpha chain
MGENYNAPDNWSTTAISIFASKYLAPEDQGDIRQALHRVAHFVAHGDLQLQAAIRDGLAEQRFSFNSPVWFNAGRHPNPQCHACFIQSVDDDMESILDLAVKEGRLFQHGSGTGSNLSKLRAQGEPLSGGGSASGPVSFMRIYDAVAGTIKSGGKTRRAAKMQILDCNHPDILSFINCKVQAEEQAQALISAGWSSDYEGAAYENTPFQNANLSVRVFDSVMVAAEEGRPYGLRARTTGEVTAEVQADSILDAMAEAAWRCGDPGVIFADTVEMWNPCPHMGEIVATNPCGEYIFHEETACNLASVRLTAYLDEDGNFDWDALHRDVTLLVRACDNIVSLAGYPTPLIAIRSQAFRTIGIGFSDLAACLTQLGMRYSSDEGRLFAAKVMATIQASAYLESAHLAQQHGKYLFWNGQQLNLASKYAHQMGMYKDNEFRAAKAMMLEAIEIAKEHGFRNAQLTAIAPTGTISFIMDCLTTGIEPLFSRDMVKKLAGGGTLELRTDIECETADELHWLDHLKMVASVQQFVDGGISKTINMPNETTPGEIRNVYEHAWQYGLKAVSVYRDGCKASQPLNKVATGERVQTGSARHSLPPTRRAVTHRFSVAGHTGYITVGMYDDGRPGEIFVQLSKEGSTLSGFVDSWAITMSVALQYGVPLDALLDKLAFTRFEPMGLTDDPNIPMAHSIIDYLARWLILQFDESDFQGAGNACPECGELMVRTGTCQACPACGHSGGCG